MLARRFLGCVFVLTILAVIAGFAFFQYGGQVLTRAATPAGHFRAPPPGDSGPDYRQAANWLARPDLPNDPSRWVPSEVGQNPGSERPEAATFFIHPTTYLERDRWNGPIMLDGEAKSRTDLFIQSQASAFNAVSEVWAPRYRQAAFGAFLLTSEDATKALDLAYSDVLKAFDSFLAAQSSDRPLIVAGHSQGSLHLLRLLRDRRQALSGRLIAAYVIGWPVSSRADLPATGLAACSAREQANCLLSWQSFGEPANTALVTGAWVGTRGLTGGTRQLRDMVCVNPLTGAQDRNLATPATNDGTLVPNSSLSDATLEPQRVGAQCQNGFLIVRGDLPDYGPYVLPGNNYHVFDYALFWENLRRDAAVRLNTYRASR